MAGRIEPQAARKMAHMVVVVCNNTLLDRDRVERARTGGERERGASGGAYEDHRTTEVDCETDGFG